MGRTCSTYWGRKNSCKGLVGKSEGNRPLGIPRHSCRIIQKWMLEKDDGMILAQANLLPASFWVLSWLIR